MFIRLPTLVILAVAMFFISAGRADARARYHSHRIGGYNSHGKGSHYVGGYVRHGHYLSKSHSKIKYSKMK